MDPDRSAHPAVRSAVVPEVNGALLFSRYAYPPNELGYCGPDDAQSLLEYGASGLVDAGLGSIARGFSGAWPYLELISQAADIADPLDLRVVEAYWVGNPLLEKVDMTVFGNSLRERFRPRTGKNWSHLAEAVPEGALPHHNFHVFGVYPWVGLLTREKSEQPLNVLEKCRIRWGQVESVAGDDVTVRSRPLKWNGRALSLGAPRSEVVAQGVAGVGFVHDLVPGEWVSLHWDWVCDRLTGRQLSALRQFTRQQLLVTNHRLAQPAAAAVLETA